MNRTKRIINHFQSLDGCWTQFCFRHAQIVYRHDKDLLSKDADGKCDWPGCSKSALYSYFPNVRLEFEGVDFDVEEFD